MKNTELGYQGMIANAEVYSSPIGKSRDIEDEPKEGYYGGQVCGPVFRDIAERCASYLNIPPDKTPGLTNAPPLVAGVANQFKP